MRIVDTDFLIAFLSGDEAARDMAQKLEDDDNFGTTAISAMELFVGAYKNDKAKETVRKILSKFDVLELNEENVEIVADVFNSCKKKGQTLDINDAMIAGIVISRGHTLVTRNVRHFNRIDDLHIEVW